MSPSLIASAISLLATSAPIRIEAIHILHPPPGAEWLLSFAQSLIKEKLALRVIIFKYLKFQPDIVCKSRIMLIKFSDSFARRCQKSMRSLSERITAF